MTQADPFFLGYQGMKVASMTIERAILDRRPGAAVERHHWLTAATLRAFRQTRDWMSGVGPVYDSFRHQVVMAEGVPDKLADRERIIVLVGFRDPLDHAISAFFQNAAFFCPWLTYHPALVELEVHRLIDAFNASFAGMLWRLQFNIPALTLREHLLDLKLGGIHRWFASEFNSFFGIDVYQVETGPSEIIRLDRPPFEIVLYRFERLKTALPALLDMLEIGGSQPISNVNVAADKQYRLLYRRFRELFAPPPDMVEYYYGDRWGPYFDHFYPGVSPLVR
jgi:hypothetical protein